MNLMDTNLLFWTDTIRSQGEGADLIMNMILLQKYILMCRKTTKTLQSHTCHVSAQQSE